MCDDFDQVYEDELDALLEMEEEIGDEFDPFPTKSKKSLDFSTPSTRHVKPRRNEGGESGKLDDSFPTPLADTSPKVNTASSQATRNKLKRSQQEMFGDLSDSETEDSADLPDIKHKSKKARLHSGPPPVLDEDFVITPPSSPRRPALDIHLRKKTTNRGEDFLQYQERITQGYDLERPRVLPRMPLDRDFVKVTDFEGRRVFMEVKTETKQEKELAKLATGRGQMQLLGVSLDDLKAQIDDARTNRLLEKTRSITDRARRGAVEEEEVVVRASDEVSDDDDEVSDDHPALWVDRYAPKRYTDLLSDESTNRLLLKWLKQWDYVVFGKQIKMPRQKEQKKTDQWKEKKNVDSKGKPFFKKNVPEVTEELDQHKRPLHKVALLCGPPGLGKTTLAHVIASHTGYNVVEMNASDDRSADVFKTRIEAATQMKAVMGQDPRPNCLIIDEIDGAPLPAINQLLTMIKDPEASGTKKKKKGQLLLRPIICICNDLYTPSLRQLRSIALTITVPPTLSAKLASRLQQIANFEKLKTDLTTLLALCEKADNDVRSCLNTLQFVRSRCKELTLSAVNSTSVGQKDVQKSLFTVWQGIFNMPKPKRKRYINPHDRENFPVEELERMTAVNQSNLTLEARFETVLKLTQQAGESEKVMQGLYENYLQAKVKDPGMDKLLLANSWMCFADQVNKEVMSNQNYILYRYTPYLPVAFHLAFASNHHPRIQYPHSQYENLVKLNKANSLMEALLNDMAPSVKKNLNLPVVVMEMLPPLLDIIKPNIRPINTQLYSQREKDELKRLIHIMIGYNMTYHQERDADGQYFYRLDPSVDEVSRLANVKTHRQLTYAAKQLIAREIELEKMRRMDRGKEETKSVPVPTPVEAGDKKSEKEGETQVPNHLRQTLKPLALKHGPVETQEIDFFGRKIKRSEADVSGASTNKTKSETRKEIIGGDIWFSFKEGFTNAVRRTIRLSDLL